MKYSVVIRCKNEERWIGYAIQSIVDNIPHPVEIIIIDNNSSDNSNKIVGLFENRELNRNVIIKKLNIDDYTPGKALNTAIKYCTGDIVMIMSAHCVLSHIDHEKIEKLLHNHIAIWGKQIPVFNGKKINRHRYVWSNFRDTDAVNFFSDGECRFFLHNALCVYYRSTLQKYPFDEKLIGKEDRYWIISRINEGSSSYYDSSLSCFHHYTDNGSTWKNI